MENFISCAVLWLLWLNGSLPQWHTIFHKKSEVNYLNSYVPAENTYGYFMVIILLNETLNLYISYFPNILSVNKLALKITVNKENKLQIKS